MLPLNEYYYKITLKPSEDWIRIIIGSNKKLPAVKKRKLYFLNQLCSFGFKRLEILSFLHESEVLLKTEA